MIFQHKFFKTACLAALASLFFACGEHKPGDGHNHGEAAEAEAFDGQFEGLADGGVRHGGEHGSAVARSVWIQARYIRSLCVAVMAAWPLPLGAREIFS